MDAAVGQNIWLQGGVIIGALSGLSGLVRWLMVKWSDDRNVHLDHMNTALDKFEAMTKEQRENCRRETSEIREMAAKERQELREDLKEVATNNTRALLELSDLIKSMKSNEKN